MNDKTVSPSDERLAALRLEFFRHSSKRGIDIFNALTELEDRRREASRTSPEPGEWQGLIDALNWALGCGDDFRLREEGEGAYWWRKELAERAGLTYDREAGVYARAASIPTQPGVRVKGLADYLWQEFCELPDRSSPEDYPDHALVTLPELTAVIETWVELSALTPAPTNGGEAIAWACLTCNSPRSVDPCPKCGTALTKPADGWEWPGLPDIDRIRELAREVGYAVGVHGSLERDFDLIAAPWVADAVGPMELAEHIAFGLGGNVVDFERQDKPCGRWSCNIHTPDWTKMIDLSVMPPTVPGEVTDENGFIIGDPVEKFTGEARWEGILVASYLTTAGHRRYVVEVKPQGFQMIAAPSQLRMLAALTSEQSNG